jgi:hypothetical protein
MDVAAAQALSLADPEEKLEVRAEPDRSAMARLLG